MATKKVTTEEKNTTAKKTTTKSTAKKATTGSTTASKRKTAVKKVETALDKRGILYVGSEAFPFAGTGGLGEVIGSLPSRLNTLGGYEARVIVPLYDSVPAIYRDKMTFMGNITVPVAWRNQYCGLFKLVYNDVTYYFVDNEYYFKRNSLYGYGDDGERFAFFSRAVLELLPMLDFNVDVLHCNDWHTALVPIYYKLYYMYKSGFNNIRTVFTIHNIEYQGQFSPSIIEDLFGISKNEYMSIDWHGCINLMKGAIDYADYVSTVSQTYAKEIQTAEYAHGLESVLQKNAHKTRGILNGIDTKVYDPATSTALFKNYSANDMTGKAENKAELQKMLGLNVDPNVPVIAMITRLVGHKGIGLVRGAFNDIMNSGAQFIVLGTGEGDHENFFRHMQNLYGNRVHAVIAFNKDMAQKIYAGADMFLMPSISEPCGLSQMIALRYGTVPIVRATGGLGDSIFDCAGGENGNGFVFGPATSQALKETIERATNLYYNDKDAWNALTKRAIECDYSWKESAVRYKEFYDEMF